MAKCAYVKVKQNVIILETPFFKNDFVTELKARSVSRRWDDDLKAWMIDRNEGQLATEIIKKHFFCAYLIEGAMTTNIHTGETRKQILLF